MNQYPTNAILKWPTLPFVAAIAVAIVGWPWAAPTASIVPVKVAFFGFELVNTSLEQTNDDERRRIVMTGEQLVQLLQASERYQVVLLSNDLKKKITASADISGCNGCQLSWAREAGADLAAWGTVQKVSNLILNMNVYMNYAQDGRPYFSHSVDIRGNTDESWRRGMSYLLRHYLFDGN